MTKRQKTLDLLADYFIEKGHVLSEREYIKATDTPIRYRLVKRQFGSWSRIETMLAKFLPGKYGQIQPVEVDEEKLADAEAAQKAEEMKQAILAKRDEDAADKDGEGNEGADE